MTARYGGRFAQLEHEARRVQKEPVVIWRKQWVVPKGAANNASTKVFKWVRTGDVIPFPEDEDNVAGTSKMMEEQKTISGEEGIGEVAGPPEASTTGMELDVNPVDDPSSYQEQPPGADQMELSKGAELHAEQAAADAADEGSGEVTNDHNDELESTALSLDHQPSGIDTGTASTSQTGTPAALAPAGDEGITSLAQEQGSIAIDDQGVTQEGRLQAPIEPAAEETLEEEASASVIPSTLQAEVEGDTVVEESQQL